MLDETIITEPPPLYNCYCRKGEQAWVPITGNRAKRILHGAINMESGDVLLLIPEEGVHETHQHFLEMTRSHWRGWNIVLVEDRGTPHKAEDSLEVAAALGIQIRLLPRATPELNAMDHLWRFVKGKAVAARPTPSLEESADTACRYLLEMSRENDFRKQASALAISG
jgi:hypothetical protein